MKRLACLIALILFGPVLYCDGQQAISDASAFLELSSLKKVAEVEDRFQSINIEMCEVVGGDFWVPYDMINVENVRAQGFAALKRRIPSINLYDKKLRMLSGALGPMYVRVSGTWANTTYFQDNDEPKLKQVPEGYENVLTRAEWKGVIDFCKATGAKLVTSFAITNGMRDLDGNWTSSQVGPLLAYTKEIGGEIYAAEMFNEPSHASHGGAPHGYDAAAYAKDFEIFSKYVSKAAPNMKIMGPGSTGEGGILPRIDSTMSTDKILLAKPAPKFDIFSYHYYGGISKRCSGQLTPENALSEEWLSRTEEGLVYYEAARNQFLPDAPIWLTETAEAACGGNPWAATFVDSFRYLEQLGRLAKKGVQVVMHNTLAASEYALLDQETHEPRPNYWAALIWAKFMGKEVYEAKVLVNGLDVFVHNLKNASNGYAVLLVNPKDTDLSIQIPSIANQYLLSAEDILSKDVHLNGTFLKLNPDGTLPEINGKEIQAGKLVIPAKSIMFLTFN
jgi:heparanase